jgi:hypothetical protein
MIDYDNLSIQREKLVKIIRPVITLHLLFLIVLSACSVPYKITVTEPASTITVTISGPTVTITSPVTVDYGTLPLGETGGLCYVDGSFNNIANFNTLYVDITLYNEPSSKDGLYFQLYQSTINGIGFYFGLIRGKQSVNGNVIEKYLIFSRWESNDLTDVRTVESGWLEKGDDNGAFVGIRYVYNWTSRSYRFKLAYIETDSIGDWYGLWILDKDSGNQEFAGSVRFPMVEQDKSGISPSSTTWIELFYKNIQQTPLPSWHVSVDGMYATDAGLGDRNLHSVYSSIEHTDVYYDSVNKKIHLVFGPEVNRSHPAGELFNGLGFLPFD